MSFNDEIFSFKWKIENFSMCTGDFIQSPNFTVQQLDETEWMLRLYFKGITDINKTILLLQRSSTSGGPDTIQIGFEICFLASDGSPYFKENRKCEFRKGKFVSPIIVSQEEFLSKVSPSDTVTVLCLMWKCKDSNDSTLTGLFVKSDMLLTSKWRAVHDMFEDTFKYKRKSKLCNLYPNKCFAITRFSIERRSIIYHLKKFSNFKQAYNVSIPVSSISKQTPSLLLTLHMSQDSPNMEISIRTTMKDINHACFLKCKIWILSKKGKPRCLIETGNLFQAKDSNVWKVLTFEERLLLAENNIYLQDDVLSFKFDLQISAGVEISRIRELRYVEPSINDNCTRTLVEDLFKFYTEQIFCDLNLRAGDGSVGAHKVVLCAKSPVFRAMFENDMSEKKNGIVDIPDMDIDTLKRMLIFMYSEKFENLLCEYDAVKLYSAADKYQYASLKEECSTFLASNLLVANVCEILELADMHQDVELKMAAQDYIRMQSNEMLRSDEWKNFILMNVPLASETLGYISTMMLES